MGFNLVLKWIPITCIHRAAWACLPHGACLGWAVEVRGMDKKGFHDWPYKVCAAVTNAAVTTNNKLDELNKKQEETTTQLRAIVTASEGRRTVVKKEGQTTTEYIAEIRACKDASLATLRLALAMEKDEKDEEISIRTR